MNPNQINRGQFRQLAMLVVALASLFLTAMAASAAVLNFSAPANCVADTDVIKGGGGQLQALTWGNTAATVNGISFQTNNATVNPPGGYLSLSIFSNANGAAFTTAVAPFSGLSSSYQNILKGAVFNAGTGYIIGTARLTNLVVGHTYFVQLWVSDPRGGAGAAGTNRTEIISSGGGTSATLAFNTTQTNGGVGQFTYATFTADATFQDITIDPTASPSAVDSAQFNAIQLRDMTGVWSGTTSGNWTDPDSTTANFSGANYNAVKAAATNVYFGDLDASGAAVITTNITIGTGGVTGVNANFNNNAVPYIFGSADANGISGAYGVTLNGTNTVTFNGANTYSGSTVLGPNAQLTLNAANAYVGSTILGAGAKLTLGASGSIASSTNLTLGANSTLTVGGAGAIAGANLIDMTSGSTLDASGTSVTLGSTATLRGTGTIKGDFEAASGSSIVVGQGSNSVGTLVFNNNLTLNNHAMTFDLGMTDSADKLNIAGVLTNNGTTVISLNKTTPLLVNGTYTLITYASKIGAGTFSLAPGTDPNITINNNAGSVTLTVVGNLGGPVMTWTNLASGNSWTSSANWKNGIIATNTDAAADFSTLNITANNTVNVGSTNITIGHMIFGDTVQSHNWIIASGTNTLAVSSGSPTLYVNSGQSATISAALRGTQGFTKDGPGSLALSGITNVMSGTININGGSLAMNGPNVFTGTINATNGPLTLAGNNNFSGGVSINVRSNTLTVSSAGGLGATVNSATVPVTLNNATLTISGAASYTNNIILAAGSSNNISWPSGQTLAGSASGPISGSGVASMSIAGAAFPRFNGGANHNFTGTFILYEAGDGGMNFALSELNTSPGFGYAGSSNAVFELNGNATSRNYMGASDWVGQGTPGCTNYLGELRGSAALWSNNGRSGTTTLEIGGKNTDSTFSGPIKENFSSVPATLTPMVVRKVGTGKLTLSGTSTYTGVTDVRGGTLTLSGIFSSNTPITVASGATFELSGTINASTFNIQSGGRLLMTSPGSLGSATVTLNGLMDVTSFGSSFTLGPANLSGSGVITGAVTLATTTLNVGPIGSAGSLVVTNGDLTLNQGAIVIFDLSNNTGSGNDFIAVNGNMTKGGFGTPATISINKLVGVLGSGTYVLAQCTGTMDPSLSTITLIGAGVSDYLNVSGNQLQLVIATPPALTWTGGVAGNYWDIATSANWINAGGFPSTYADGSQVLFTNTGGTNPVVNITTAVLPTTVTVTGSTNYTFYGAGDISGSTTLIKNGPNALTILNTNTFSGTVFLNSGTLAIGNATTNGSLAAPIADNAALVFTTPADQTASNLLSGTGSFTKLGAGTLTLTTNSTLTGITTIGAGTLALGSGSISGALGNGLVTNNATLAINRSSSFAMSNAVVNNGTLINQGSGAVTLVGAVSGTGLITNTSAAGQLTLAASNSYSGGTFISGGNIMLQNFTGFGTGDVVIDDSATSMIMMLPTTVTTNLIVNNIRLPQSGTAQFVATNVSLSAMATLRLAGVISGGATGVDTPIVNGGGTPSGNSRMTVVLENAANSFTMNPEVVSGCLAFNSDGALGAPANGIVVRASTTSPFADTLNAIGLRFNADNITLNASRNINLVGVENIDVQGYSGAINGSITGNGMSKLGTGTLTLNGSSTTTGSTTIKAGTLVVNGTLNTYPLFANSGATLGGTGIIGGNVYMNSGSTLALGTPSPATLTMHGQLDLLAGSTNSMRINAAANTADKIDQMQWAIYNGTLIVTNIGGTLAIGQSYQLFNATNYSGSFIATNLPTISPNPGRWRWQPAIGTLSIIPDLVTTPTNMTFTVNGGTNLSMSWPLDHLGWKLQRQTNSLSVGLTTNNWATIPGTDLVNSTNFNIISTNPAVFFRMVYP